MFGELPSVVRDRGPLEFAIGDRTPEVGCVPDMLEAYETNRGEERD
jgi:hypothetical protein